MKEKQTCRRREQICHCQGLGEKNCESEVSKLVCVEEGNNYCIAQRILVNTL